ncbi:MAG: cytochrome c3 family protein [candidate division Zixibacteria bacterium]|nr:cytochrome c3 family protein [candidate division Zixibacteria bacterium]
MRQFIRYFFCVLMVPLLVSMVFGTAYAQNHNSDLECKRCHSCDNPTEDSPCIHVCPTKASKHFTSEHLLSEAPDTIVLDHIMKQFEPVRFDHKSHAKMSQMNSSCKTCHHYSPKDRIPPCHECHGAEDNPNNLRQPSLKGAYHRQCMSCHREWSHDTKCVVCHLSCEEDAGFVSEADSTDIVGISHPVIAVPTVKIYHTPYKPGPVVTFYHDEHVDLFGFECVDCHIDENCGYCHDLSHPDNLVKTEEEKHAMCINCHQINNCGHCHDHKRKPAFTHASTGFPLNRYHNQLECRSCHPTRKKIGKLDSHCNSCHGGWNQQNFRHSITGLMLDENHIEWDCVDCHPGNAYDKPDCSGCHDDDISMENGLPGEYIIRQ